ncbi:hypothetical protein NXW50_05175 [Bacteroides thetaiotaomicron]|nr:hypothetical protein [Bacteroides thetaiotaomicron]MCS2277636.1 hypothetical protein [Bacteroides thetaiotaomicron]
MERTDFVGPQRSVNVALQSDEGGFSVQANRASCAFGSPKLFGHPKPTCPAKPGDFSPKSKNLEKVKS